VGGIRVWTYGAWTHTIRRKIFPDLPRKEWRDVPDPVRRLKKHPALLTILREYVAEQIRAFEKEMQERLSAWAREEWQKSHTLPLIARLKQLLQALPHPDASVVDELVLKKILERAQDIPTDWAEIVTDRERLQRGLQSCGEDPFTGPQWESILRYTFKQTSEIPEKEAQEVAAQEEGDETGLLDPLDNALLLRLMQLKFGGLQTPTGSEIFFNHAVIDEAQDLSPLEIQVVLDATQDESVTLAGDTAQKLIFDNGFENWPTLLKALGKEAIHLEPLAIGYRSTLEINTFAREVLGPLAPNKPLESPRSGVPVEAFVFSQLGETFAFLSEAVRTLVERERLANVALLTLLPAQADHFYETLKNHDIPNLRRVRNQDFTFAPGIDLTDISQVKGLEYDYVVILDASRENYPATHEARHLLHIAATRAAHQLWLFATGEPSPLIPEQYLIHL
jgi:DNA helicase-2/ATP-dependent DNA helicase PcrA